MSVVVANPGAVSWMLESASAFASKGELDRYYAPVVVGQSDVRRISSSRLPAQLRTRLETELSRRAPHDIVGSRVGRVGTTGELAHVALTRTRLPLKARRAMFRPRMLAFDHGVSRKLHPGVSAVIAYQGAATRTFGRARALGIATVLDHPAAHYATVDPVLREEADLVPEFGATLVRGYAEWQRRRYEQELKLADRIIVLSSYHQRSFENAGIDPARTFRAPLCVDLDMFTPADEPPTTPFRVAFVGQIGQHKGISYLLDGFARADLGPGAELLMVGQPIAPEVWINRPGVRHVGALPRRQLASVLRDCHAIALPSLSEGFGAAPLEGMACGVPAIVSDRTFAHDVIEDGIDGWVVPIRDADAIAERLQLLHDDPERQATMGRAARAKAEQYPWSRYRDALYAGVSALLHDRA